MTQDNSALTSVRVARSLRRAIVGILISAILTPAAYYLAISTMAESMLEFAGDDGFVVLAAYQYQVSPGFALFPNLALLAGVTLLGIPRISPWPRTGIVMVGAIFAAAATWLIAGTPAPITPEVAAICAALIVGWTLAALPLSKRKPGWGRP